MALADRRLHTGKDLMSYRPVLPVPGDGLVHSSACLDIPVFHPWTHIIGATLNYNDEYTGLVFRLEQSFSTTWDPARSRAVQPKAPGSRASLDHLTPRRTGKSTGVSSRGSLTLRLDSVGPSLTIRERGG
jgi:hypothetical protein